MIENKLILRHFGLAPYTDIWRLMSQFTKTRTPSTFDEIWIGEHLPVFTQGQAGKPEHLLDTAHIPVIQSDRGGQATYHGPGQLILYFLIDLKRKRFSVRSLVTTLQNAVIDFLASYPIVGTTETDSPGIYVTGSKIASLGFRIHRGCSYHGLSLNVNLDLAPFARINPCGEPTRKIVQISDFIPTVEINDVQKKIVAYLHRHLNYTTMTQEPFKDFAEYDLT